MPGKMWIVRQRNVPTVRSIRLILCRFRSEVRMNRQPVFIDALDAQNNGMTNNLCFRLMLMYMLYFV